MPEANMVVEKRLHPRFTLKIPLKYRVIEETNEMKKALEHNQKDQISHTFDVSLGGVYLVADHVLDVGSILRMEITIPKTSQIISAYAQVVWSNESGGGLHFESMKVQDEEALKKYLSTVPEVNMNR